MKKPARIHDLLEQLDAPCTIGDALDIAGTKQRDALNATIRMIQRTDKHVLLRRRHNDRAGKRRNFNVLEAVALALCHRLYIGTLVHRHQLGRLCLSLIGSQRWPLGTFFDKLDENFDSLASNAGLLRYWGADGGVVLVGQLAEQAPEVVWWQLRSRLANEPVVVLPIASLLHELVSRAGLLMPEGPVPEIKQYAGPDFSNADEQRLIDLLGELPTHPKNVTVELDLAGNWVAVELEEQHLYTAELEPELWAAPATLELRRWRHEGRDWLARKVRIERAGLEHGNEGPDSGDADIGGMER